MIIVSALCQLRLQYLSLVTIPLLVVVVVGRGG